MRRVLLATTGLAWLALTGTAGAVTVTISDGPADPQYFAPEAAGQNNFTLGDITWTLVTGPASTQKGTVPGQYAAPLGMGTSTTTGTTYFAVEDGGVEQATWSTAQTSLKIYWGSVDAATVDGIGNQISITVDGYTLTGADLIAMGVPGDGSQGAAKDNVWVTISGLGPFTSVDFSDTGANAFEFSLGTVPEPSTWTMLALGFAGLGYAAFRRNSKKSQMATGAI
jgi:PEP-CTERM motif